jgi:predicted nucleotidyltransferase
MAVTNVDRDSVMHSQPDGTAPDSDEPRVAELARLLAQALAQRVEIAEAYLFGSRATGRAQAHSDIDVAVYVDPDALRGHAYGYAADLTAHLMHALATNEIDVVVLNGAPPVLYHRVIRDGRRVLARDLRATTTREGYALSRYCDYVPQLAKMEAARRTLSQGAE